MYGPGTLDPLMPRRSVYFFIKRSRLVPMMMLFDWPEPLVSLGQRSTTTTAPQALSFLNGELARRCAAAFADRVAVGGGDPAVAARGYRIAFGRDPTEAETHADIVRLDAASVQFLDSTALGVLLASAQRLAAKGGRLELMNASPAVRRILDMTLISRTVHVLP